MQPVQAVIAAWPFLPGKVDPQVFFRENPLRFQGLIDSVELLLLLQRGAFTAMEYVLPLPTGSVSPRLMIRYSSALDNAHFAAFMVRDGREEALQCFHSPHCSELDAWLRHFIATDLLPAPSELLSAPAAQPMFTQGSASPQVEARQFIVAYVRASERRRSGHSVRAAFEYRKAHAGATPIASPKGAGHAPVTSSAHARPAVDLRSSVSASPADPIQSFPGALREPSHPRSFE